MARTSKKFGTKAHPHRYPPGSVPPDLFPRSELISRSGVGSRKITALTIQGIVKPVAYTTSNIALFNDDTVEAVVRYRRDEEAGKGEISAETYTTEESIKVFQALKEGKRPVEITISTGVDPRRVEAISKRYLAMSGGIFMSQEALDRISDRLIETGNAPRNEDGRPVRITEADALYSVIRVLTKKSVCRRCRKTEPADECAECVLQSLEKEIERIARERTQATQPSPG